MSSLSNASECRSVLPLFCSFFLLSCNPIPKNHSQHREFSLALIIFIFLPSQTIQSSHKSSTLYRQISPYFSSRMMAPCTKLSIKYPPLSYYNYIQNKISERVTRSKFGQFEIRIELKRTICHRF